MDNKNLDKKNAYNILILTTVMAPYRIDLFNELGKYDNMNLTVCFEQSHDESRNNNWYKKNFKFFKGIFLKNSTKSLYSIKWDFINKISNKYDAIFFYEYSTITSILSIINCRMKKIKYFINCDGAIIKKFSLKDIIKKFCIKNATACLANGKSAKKYFLKYGAIDSNIYLHQFSSLFKHEILNNPVSIDKKKLLRKKLQLNFDRVYVSVGSFIDRKGFDLLLSAISNIHCANEIGFIIIGGGPNKQKYLEFIKINNINNVVLIDFVSKKEVFEYYDAADAFVFPTREDIWGLVINEAMSRGLPILSSDMCMAAIELVDETNGFIFTNDSSSSLGNALKKLNSLNADELKLLGQLSINKIRDYNIESLAKSHLDVIKKVI